jgi:hypothetical protein
MAFVNVKQNEHVIGSLNISTMQHSMTYIHLVEK